MRRRLTGTVSQRSHTGRDLERDTEDCGARCGERKAGAKGVRNNRHMRRRGVLRNGQHAIALRVGRVKSTEQMQRSFGTVG